MILLTVVFLSVGPLKAQVFIADDEFEGMMRKDNPDFALVSPLQGFSSDQYLPLGDGVLLLVGLGGAYLLRKRNKKK
ncbi:MAG: hypothetical protein IKO23_07760 [Bacteroidales bacterium]|nr:hypothetical protein [Bacteroidales bacterium]